MILALAIQFAGLTAKREALYARAWNLSVPEFERKAAGTHVMTLISDWHCLYKLGDIVLPKGSAVFVDSTGRPRWTDVGWPIWRTYSPLPHNVYPVKAGDPVGATHLMSNRYPWPSEVDSVSSAVKREFRPGPRRSFFGKLIHWLHVD